MSCQRREVAQGVSMSKPRGLVQPSCWAVVTTPTRTIGVPVYVCGGFGEHYGRMLHFRPRGSVILWRRYLLDELHVYGAATVVAREYTVPVDKVVEAVEEALRATGHHRPTGELPDRPNRRRAVPGEEMLPFFTHTGGTL